MIPSFLKLTLLLLVGFLSACVNHSQGSSKLEGGNGLKPNQNLQFMEPIEGFPLPPASAWTK
ncbi:hypothetical protein Rhal01_02529 [Rubritalea halochordaticola]|uniref:Membrane or secreted protein n=1 Tax=Rubritalea halochordaticola TaxID=714537 RepID=A0ABP9V0Y0_9BACT